MKRSGRKKQACGERAASFSSYSCGRQAPRPQGSFEKTAQDGTAVAQAFNRLMAFFAALSEQRRTAFVPYVTGGDPDLYGFRKILSALPEAGADMVEVGLPSRAPVMDGPVVAAAHDRARTAGVTVASVLSTVADFRKDNPDIPIVIMGYRDAVEARGAEAFVDDVAASGADAILIADLTEDEWNQLDALTIPRKLAAVRVVPPDADKSWIKAALPSARGFVYAVAAKGKTGSEPLSPKKLAKRVARIREAARLPVGVGFGIRTADQARAYAGLADALFVGSALAEAVERNILGDPSEAVAERVRELSAALRDSA